MTALLSVMLMYGIAFYAGLVYPICEVRVQAKLFNTRAKTVFFTWGLGVYLGRKLWMF